MGQPNITRFYRKLGESVKKYREKRLGITQEALGKIVGLSRTSIANIESGRQRVQVHMLSQIAQALSVEPSRLIPEFLPDYRQLPENVSSKLRPEEMQIVASILDTIKEESPNEIRRGNKKKS